MSDAQAIPATTKREAGRIVDQFKRLNGYTNVALIGPVSSVQTVELGGANWLVVGTSSRIEII